jgi:hypothetical protein
MLPTLLMVLHAGSAKNKYRVADHPKMTAADAFQGALNRICSEPAGQWTIILKHANSYLRKEG